MDKRGQGLLIGVVAFFLIFASLPALGAMAGSALDEVISVLLAIAPKVAVVSGIAALILVCIPFTRHHAHGMLFGAILLAIGAAGFSAVVAWLGAHSGVLTADMLSGGNQLLAHLGGG